MSIRKVKSSPKIFISDQKKLQQIVVTTMQRISDIVSSTMGPGGRNVLIESDYPGIPNKNTKDGVTVFNSLGAHSSFEHLIIEQARDAAKRTASEAGDGTTTATVLAAAMINNLYAYCQDNPKLSPQRVARDIARVVRKDLVPLIRNSAIKIEFDKNIHLLKSVAQISANGDEDMAEAVIKAFELLEYGENAHITIKEVSGPYGYEVSKIEGYPITIGYEESMGKHHPVFITDQANQRCYLEKPLYILFDGMISDLVTLMPIINKVASAFTSGESDYKNMVIFAHGYGESVLQHLMYNFVSPETINIVPMVTPKAPFANAQTHFLADLAAFTNAKVFSATNRVAEANIQDLGSGAEAIEIYRYRTTMIGQPDELNIQVRAENLETQKNNAESQAERGWLEERLGKITSGIVKLSISGGSNGELKEAHDRCEDAVCSVRSAIAKGALPGGCRMLLDLMLHLSNSDSAPQHVKDVLIPSLIEPIGKILENAGYSTESESEDEDSEIGQIINKLLGDQNLVFDVASGQFGNAEELGLFDSVPAVEEALKNATSISTIMGTVGGIVAYPRDDAMEREEAKADSEFQRIVDNPTAYANEANSRI